MVVYITSFKIDDWIKKLRFDKKMEKTGFAKEISIWDLKGKIVIIAEKPKAASKIAPALSPKYNVYKLYGVPYYVINTGYSHIYIVPATGHLYGLDTSISGYPVFEYDWKPIYEIDRNAKHTYYFLKTIEKLCSEADYYVNACDYDIEGSVIGYLIIKFHGNIEKSFRAKFSSLAYEELRESFRRLNRLDWEMIEAGLCRHELDWLWGINISRALMNAVREVSNKKIVLSAGRVQTPTLKYVVDNNISRNLFIPIPQYTLSVTIIKDGKEFRLDYAGSTIETRDEAENLIKILNTDKLLLVTDYREEVVNYNPLPAFNLGDLQSEAARIYGFSPYKTQSIAEKLYLEALISYPRTNSQKLPPSINYRVIVESLGKIDRYRNLVRELLTETHGYLKPVQGVKEDPAHPAIYPTGNIPSNLSVDEWKIYDLITRRFLAAFASKAVVERRHVVFKHSDSYKLVFQTSGQKVIIQGWLKYYPFITIEERIIPKFRVGERVIVSNAEFKRIFTKPPERISKIKLLKWMENVEIGTESTRARIIELLFKRKYLRNTSRGAEATDIGLGVIEVLSEYFPELTSVELTRFFEKEMEKIRNGFKNRNEVIEEARNTIKKLLSRFDDKKIELGQLLCLRLGLLKTKNKCILCNREVYNRNLCKYHYLAFEEIKKQYLVWKNRERVDYKQYISILKRLNSTGRWIKEVLNILDNIQ